MKKERKKGKWNGRASDTSLFGGVFFDWVILFVVYFHFSFFSLCFSILIQIFVAMCNALFLVF